MTVAEAGINRTQLESLYRRLERPIYNVVLRSVWSEQEAADLVQESFVRLWAMRRRVRPETVEPLVWRIAMNLVSKRRRWRRLRRFVGLSVVGADDTPTPDRALADHERDRRVREAVDRLSNDLRDVVLLTAFSGLSYREVADLLGIPEGTVGSRRARAVRELRETLGDPGSTLYLHEATP